MRLFNSTTRSVALSDAGRAFVDRIAPAVAEIRGAMKAAHAQRVTPAVLLRITASVQVGRAIAPLVLAFLRRFPDMRVDLVTGGGWSTSSPRVSIWACAPPAWCRAT